MTQLFCQAGEAEESIEIGEIEVLLVRPIEAENLRIWIPAGKYGPEINRSCRVRKNCMYSMSIGSEVNHTKSNNCMNGYARILAEQVSIYHNLPVTIFDGWQWEYAFDLSDYSSATFDLGARGGSWECMWEAIFSLTSGRFVYDWIGANSVFRSEGSEINILTYSSMRTRDGYPKERKL
jgi:hypothetical protein